MNAKNIRCLVQNYFIDTEGNILSDKISENYYNALTDEQMKVWNEIWGVEY